MRKTLKVRKAEVVVEAAKASACDHRVGSELTVAAGNYDLYVNFDGACWPNPAGHATWGIIVQNKAGEVVMEESGEVGSGPKMSNNVAEYTAALRALQAIEDLAAPGWNVVLRGDSQLVINKLDSERISKGLCRDACIAAQELFRTLKGKNIFIDLLWVPRAENEQADALTEAGYGWTTIDHDSTPDWLAAQEAHLAVI